MSEAIKIQGQASFQNIEMGFWGIETKMGKKYRPINMPEQLKVNGANVSCEAKPVNYDVDIFMWGEAVEIISFETPFL